MKLVGHPVFPSMVIIGHRAIDDTAPIPHDPSTDPPVGDTEAGTPDESAIQTALVVIAKGTFAIDDPAATPVADQADLLMTDETTGDDDELTLAESDLAVYKPRADVVVRGGPDAPAPPEPGATLIGGLWDEHVAIGPQVMTQSFPAVPVEPMTFGWQPRTDSPRLDHAGRYGEAPTAFVASDHRLPVDFSNRFFNGGTYTAGNQPVFTHPAPSADVVVSTSGEFDLPGGGTESVTESVTLHLTAAFPTATVRYRNAIGQPRSSELPMQADTIVYDKTGTTFTVTWRANFDFLAVPSDRYEAILVTGGL